MAQSIKKIAVIGTGVIGSSWTTLFLSKGFQVIVSDPAPNAKENLSNFIKAEWPRMQRLGLSSTADPSNYEVVDDITHHLHDVDFVQEVRLFPLEDNVVTDDLQERSGKT